MENLGKYLKYAGIILNLYPIYFLNYFVYRRPALYVYRVSLNIYSINPKLGYGVEVASPSYYYIYQTVIFLKVHCPASPCGL